MCRHSEVNYGNRNSDAFASGGDGYTPRVRAKKANKTAYEPHQHTTMSGGSCMPC